MSSDEGLWLWLLVIITLLLAGILKYLHLIYLHLERGIRYDAEQSVNAYGENLPVALQEGLVRGQRGISQYDGMR